MKKGYIASTLSRLFKVNTVAEVKEEEVPPNPRPPAPPIPDVVPLVISDPVRIIAEKIKANPKRLRIREVMQFLCGSSICEYLVVDKPTGVKFTLVSDNRRIRVSGANTFFDSTTVQHWEVDFESEFASLTEDESTYLIQEGKGIVEEHYKKLLEKSNSIRDHQSVKKDKLERTKMQKLFEES